VASSLNDNGSGNGKSQKCNQQQTKIIILLLAANDNLCEIIWNSRDIHFMHTASGGHLRFKTFKNLLLFKKLNDADIISMPMFAPCKVNWHFFRW